MYFIERLTGEKVSKGACLREPLDVFHGGGTFAARHRLHVPCNKTHSDRSMPRICKCDLFSRVRLTVNEVVLGGHGLQVVAVHAPVHARQRVRALDFVVLFIREAVSAHPEQVHAAVLAPDRDYVAD